MSVKVEQPASNLAQDVVDSTVIGFFAAVCGVAIGLVVLGALTVMTPQPVPTITSTAPRPSVAKPGNVGGAGGVAGSGAAGAALASPGSPVDAGRALFIAPGGCSNCHRSPDAPDAGRAGPDLKGLGSRETFAGVIPTTPDNLALWIENAPAVKPGTMMPPKGGMALDRAKIEALAAYLMSLK